MILIQNATLVNPYGEIKEGICDILIRDGKIQKIEKQISVPQGAEILDVQGLMVMPAFVDMHVHLREPGYEYKEDIASGSRAAVCGGYAQIACMPNTNPTNDSVGTTRFILKKARDAGQATVLPIASVTMGLKGETLCDFSALKRAGAIAFSDDGRPVQNAYLMREALEITKEIGSLVISHCEDLDLLRGGVMNEGTRAKELGLPGIDRSAEEVMASRDMILSENTGGRLHLAHVSTKGNVELIRQAKRRGVDVTAETCPHYFSADESWVTPANTNAKMNPPLRTREDVEAIIQGLKDGTIDILSTDHAPHSAEEKKQDFIHAPMGIVGLETAFSLAVTNLVVPGHLTIQELVGMMSYRPAKRLGIQGGVLAEQETANITIVNPKEEYVLREEDLHSKSKNTPFLGKKMQGRVYCTIVNGEIKFRR